ncbi:MAG: S66 peptidase family protein [Bacillota bacterium]
MKLKAKALKEGSTVGVIAPASHIHQRERIAKGVEALEKMGFNVVMGSFVYGRDGYLAGTDQERVADINKMFSAPEIEAIFCLRGGYGSLRLLHLLDYRMIRKHAKILVGYSDITALHLALTRKTGLVTFHGAMVASDLGNELTGYTLNSFKKALTTVGPLGPLPLPEGLTPIEIYPGETEGELIGGNLSLIIATLGTPYEIETSGRILFLEEINEEPYRVDRMLTQLRLSGALDRVAGLVIGECVACQSRQRGDEADGGYSLLEVLTDRLGSLGVPCLYGLPLGHGRNKATIPLGVKVSLNASTGILAFLEGALN